jgi:hypothetical protein
MPQICRQCSRANPMQALYCHFDGVLLRRTHEVPADGGRINFGTRVFATPLVFAPGKVCRNFNELALACNDDPATARELLRRGYLENFLSSQGRLDLARAAADAARTADPARGLDDFLEQLPGNALRPARLRLSGHEFDLGTLRPGEERRFQVSIHNEGMRLLTGTAKSGCPWLVLGDGPGVRQKLLEVAGKFLLPVRIEGRSLRAYHRRQTGEVIIDTNGGRAVVLAHVLVPVQPFPEGVLAGVISPRELAQRARDNPRAAAELIESGAVARWYQANGWSYPVRGPAASGVGAVQQLFEALGLVRAPRVQVGTPQVRLDGWPGESVEYAIPVTTTERAAVVAYGVSDQPWLCVRPTVYQKRTALVPLVVPVVPHEPDVTLRSCVTITANGNQRFEVHVTLSIHGESPDSTWPQEAPAAAVEILPPAAIPIFPAEEPAAPVPVAAAVEAVVLPAAIEQTAEAPESVPLYYGPSLPRWRHLVPLVLLVLGLGAALAHDAFVREASRGVARLELDPDGPLAPGESLTVKAQVRQPQRGQTLTLEVVEGPLVAEGPATRRVGTPAEAITWRLRAQRDGPWQLRITSSTGAAWTRDGVVRTWRPGQ